MLKDAGNELAEMEYRVSGQFVEFITGDNILEQIEIKYDYENDSYEFGEFRLFRWASCATQILWVSDKGNRMWMKKVIFRHKIFHFW